MLRLVGDLEADALLDEVTVVHCLILKDIDEGTIYRFNDQGNGPTIRDGIALMATADALYFHNGVRYDYAVLRKLYPEEWAKVQGRKLDTLVLAHIRFIHAKETDHDNLVSKGKMPKRQAGLHNLEAWGYRLGVHKAGYDGGWESWNQAMEDYCVQDVEVTHALVEHLRKAGLPAKAVEMEHKLQRYLFIQEMNGWPFDLPKAAALQARLAGRREDIAQQLVDTFGSWWEPDGPLVTPKMDRTMTKNQLCPTHYKEGAAYQKIKEVQFKPSSRLHIAKVLQERFGWKPKEFTPSGQPKVDESVLEGIDLPEARLLQEYLLLDKRLGMLSEGRQAWIEQAKVNPETGGYTIHHSCRPGPITHRMRHSHPNLAQVPSVGSPYGGDCRELFTVPEGWQLLGVDVSGLELRVLAHHMATWDGGEYGKEVVSGDVHTLNQNLVGLDTRDQAKTFIYALIYGAGNEKLGTVKDRLVRGERRLKRIGKQARESLEAGLPALSNLTKAARAVFKRRGYVRLLDGRRAYPRAEHSALNTLIQGDGAIICKTWVVHFADAMTKAYGEQGWDGKWAALGFVHDEIQIAVRPEVAQMAAQTALKAITSAGNALGVSVPLTGESTLGANWKETH